MITRRDLIAAAIAASITLACVSVAEEPRKVLDSTAWNWSDLASKKTEVGELRNVVNQPTRTLANLEMHITTLNPHTASHPPHTHPNEEMVARSRQLGTPENARVQEFVMVMNAFDTNFDEENEVYAVNTVANAYSKHPIIIDRARTVRVYLVNVTEFDPINSFHLHGNFFDYYDHGTTLTPTLRTVDTVMQCQGQRGILEFSFAGHEPGLYMCHAHQSEFAELGWMSMFDVRESVA